MVLLLVSLLFVPASNAGWGPQTILIFWESVEQYVALYKGCARNRASISLSARHLILHALTRILPLQYQPFLQGSIEAPVRSTR